MTTLTHSTLVQATYMYRLVQHTSRCAYLKTYKTNYKTLITN